MTEKPYTLIRSNNMVCVVYVGDADYADYEGQFVLNRKGNLYQFETEKAAIIGLNIVIPSEEIDPKYRTYGTIRPNNKKLEDSFYNFVDAIGFSWNGFRSTPEEGNLIDDLNKPEFSAEESGKKEGQKQGRKIIFF